jgi:hypothetical protein
MRNSVPPVGSFLRKSPSKAIKSTLETHKSQIRSWDSNNLTTENGTAEDRTKGRVFQISRMIIPDSLCPRNGKRRTSLNPALRSISLIWPCE